MEEHEELFQTLETCIVTSLQGALSDPEYDFSAMRENTGFSELSNQTLYQKTGKNLTVPRISKVLKLVILIDNNQNFQIWVKKAKNFQILEKIQEAFKNDLIIETLYIPDEPEKHQKEEYSSFLEELIEKAQYEIQQGNIVVLVSDFLSSSYENNESLQALSSDHFIALQINIPPFSKSYHQFYLKDLEKPQINHWFRL